MNNGIDAFRLRLQKELGLSISPKDPLLAQWLSQKELLEENAAEHQRESPDCLDKSGGFGCGLNGVHRRHLHSPDALT